MKAHRPPRASHQSRGWKRVSLLAIVAAAVSATTSSCVSATQSTRTHNVSFISHSAPPKDMGHPALRNESREGDGEATVEDTESRHRLPCPYRHSAATRRGSQSLHAGPWKFRVGPRKICRCRGESVGQCQCGRHPITEPRRVSIWQRQCASGCHAFQISQRCRVAQCLAKPRTACLAVEYKGSSGSSRSVGEQALCGRARSDGRFAHRR